MKSILRISASLLLPALALLSLFSACGEEIEEEPAIYTPAQIRRLLHAGESKLWQQQTEYYLEDSCRTGFFVRFSSEEGIAPNSFLAYYYRDTMACDPGEEYFLEHDVLTPKSPAFQTTDSLLFINAAGDSTLRLVKLLTSERLQLELVEEGQVIHREEYRVVEEE